VKSYVQSSYGPILIVDDDPATRELVTTVVEGSGYPTVSAESGEAALIAIGDREPSLVLLDVRLPGVSGYEVCRQLRERFGLRLPIIFLSGERIEPHDRVAGLLIGADDYVVKPFFPEELAARVRSLLARSGAYQAAGVGTGETANLTERERQVLQLLAEGLTQTAIAAELYISPKTVGTHIQRILTKLGVHSRAEAVASAFRLRLVDTAATHALA
jgi:DNA-binding NarL/FixJ family response regulator